MLLSNLCITDVQFVIDLADSFQIPSDEIEGDSLNEMIYSIYSKAVCNAGFEGDFEIDANSIASSLNICINGVWETVYSADDFAELLQEIQ